jgi:2-polyprenyl-6-methoxyphenol hydroxylase-like FAD-dependent oxidoreductase
MAVQARTLEFYRRLGFAEDVVNKGIRLEEIHLWAHGRSVAEFTLKDFGQGVSPYPFALSFPQDEHEKFLVAQLEAAGIRVERATELLHMQETDGAIRATLRRPNGTTEVCQAGYLCGCDGAHSVVRHDLDLGFGGGTYEKTFYVADVAATGEAAGRKSFSLCLDENDFLLILPIRTSGQHRLIGIIPASLREKADLTFEDIRPFAERAAPIHVENVNWFSQYHVHHRVADYFRVGHAFLSGDAGHIHSPVGGQGMNTGIGDAVNLAWKLAAVLQGHADATILDTYEPERIAFAHALVESTDRVFQLINGSGITSHVFRDMVLPHLFPIALGFSAVSNAAFRLISQTRIHYRSSPLSEGAAGDIHGGDRLPWVPQADGTDNFAPLTSLDWQIHVYGAASQALRDAAPKTGLPLHAFAWSESAKRAGLAQDALYLVRPDGYVALADASQDVAKLRALIARFQIATRPQPPGRS